MTGADRIGGTLHGVGGYNNRAFVDQGADRILAGANHEVGTAHADRRDGCIHAEIFTRFFRRAAGDGADDSIFKIELYNGGGGIGGVIFVANDFEQAVRTDTDERIVYKANVHVATAGCVDLVVYMNPCADRNALAASTGRFDPRFAEYQAHFTHEGAGWSAGSEGLGRDQQHTSGQQAAGQHKGRQRAELVQPCFRMR